jgi:hypothetical protein
MKSRSDTKLPKTRETLITVHHTVQLYNRNTYVYGDLHFVYSLGCHLPTLAKFHVMTIFISVQLALWACEFCSYAGNWYKIRTLQILCKILN